MIFKTFDSNIDKWTTKIGVLGKSFNDFIEASNKRKIVIDDLFTINGVPLKDAKKQAGSFWSYLYPKKENIKSLEIAVPELIKQPKANEYIDIMKQLDSGTHDVFKTYQEWYDSLADGEKWIAKHGQETKGQIRNLESVAQANQQARAATIAHNEAIKAQTLSAKVGSAALKALSIAGNMIVFTLITKGIELAVKAIDNYVHRLEKLNEASAEAKKVISELCDSFKSIENSTNSIKTRYAELAQNVSHLGTAMQGQGSLSLDEYNEFLNLSNQLSELFPQLIHGYDDNGNAILNLSGNVNTIIGSLNDLIDVERKLANQKILDEMPAVWDAYQANIQNYYNKLSSLSVTVGSNNIIDEEAIRETERKIVEEYAAMKDSLYTSIPMTVEYQLLTPNGKDLVDEIISDLDINNIPNINNISWDELTEYINSHYIQAIRNVDNAQIQTAMSEMIFNDLATSEVEENFNAISEYLDGKGYSKDDPFYLYWALKYQESQERVDDVYNHLFPDHEGLDRIIVNSDTGEFINFTKGFKEQLSKLSQTDLELALTLSIPTDFNGTWEDFIELLNEYKETVNDIDNFTPTISSSVEQISKQLEPQFAKLGDAYSSIFSDDGFNLDVVDNPMLEDLRKAFAEIDEDIGVTFDANQINEFFDALENGTANVENLEEAAKITQDAFNDLATAYFYSTDTLEHLNEATAESIKQQLAQMGVVNSEEIINHYLTLAEAENDLLELQEQLAEAQKDLAESSDFSEYSNVFEYGNAKTRIDLIYDEIEAYYNEKGATEDLRVALFNLQLQQAGLSIDSINSSASVSELLRLAEVAGLSAEYMDKLNELMNLFDRYNSAQNGYEKSYYYSQIQSVRSQISNGLEMPEIELEFDFPSGKASGAASAGKDAAEVFLEGFHNELDRLKFLQDNGFITEKEYLDQLRILYENYFKDREEYLEEYVKYEHEYLNGLKSLYEDVIGGITDLLDDQIDKIAEERDAKKDALEEEQEARTKALELQKEQLDLQIEEIEAQIKGKNDAIDAINDEIDAIKKANDERQRQIDLQKAQYDLERMQNQKTILQYSEGKGMHYVNDTSGIRDAKDAVDDARREIEIADKEKQIALIEDEISLLETRKSLIEDQQADLDSQINALDEYYKKLIENTEAYYSALIQPIENYKTQFESIAEIESGAAFDEQLKSLGYSVDDILALSSSTLENFKSNYLGILSDIYAGNSQMFDSLSMVSGLDQDSFAGYLSQSQPYIDSLARLDLSSTQLAIDSANSGIHSFADGAVLATTNMTTMADTVTSLLEGDKKQAGIISSFETMTSVLADANTQIAGIASGMEALDGKTATIRINIETNGDTSLLGNAHVSGAAITGASHVEGTALASGNWAVQSNEKHALVGEIGRELIVRGGRFFTVGNYGAEMFNIKKGDIVFNHEQTEALLKNGHISGRGKAYADGTVGGGRFLTGDGRILRPLQEGDRGFDLLQKFQPLVDRIIKGEEGLITNAVFDSQKQFEQMLNTVMNNTAINNISNSRNSQPVVHQQFNITMPNVTNSTSAETLMNDLQSLSTKKFQMDW